MTDLISPGDASAEPAPPAEDVAPVSSPSGEILCPTCIHASSCHILAAIKTVSADVLISSCSLYRPDEPSLADLINAAENVEDEQAQ